MVIYMKWKVDLGKPTTINSASFFSVPVRSEKIY